MGKILLLLFLLVVSRSGLSCTSIGGLPDVEWIYENAEYLFIGKVIGVGVGNSQGVFQVRFQVMENFRGAPGNEVSVFSINEGDHSKPGGDTRISSCGCSFSPGTIHFMVVRGANKNDKNIPVGVPFKPDCTARSDVSETSYPDTDNNPILWYFREREKGLRLKYKPQQELSELLRRSIRSGNGELKISDLFMYDDPQR